MTRYLLDTNVISEPLKARPDPGVMEKLRIHEDEIAIAAPVWHELVFGCCRLPQSKKRAALQAYLDSVVTPTVRVLPYDEDAATFHGKERARLAGKGQTPSFVDGQIAAVAVMNDLVLVTRNEPDFAGFSGLRVECWHEHV